MQGNLALALALAATLSGPLAAHAATPWGAPPPPSETPHPPVGSGPTVLAPAMTQIAGTLEWDKQSGYYFSGNYQVTVTNASGAVVSQSPALPKFKADFMVQNVPQNGSYTLSFPYTLTKYGNSPPVTCSLPVSVGASQLTIKIYLTATTCSLM
jgi:hypothetical protein